MKTKLTLRMLALAALLATLDCQFSTARAQGTAFTYQGQLYSGTNLAHGIFNFTFSLYSTSNTASLINGPLAVNGVSVTNGLFTVPVDFGPGAFTGTSNWLQIAVTTNGSLNFTNLSPRQQLTPAPYAVFAETVGTVPSNSLSGLYGSAVTMNNPGNVFGGNGFALTSLNAANLSGTISDSQLSGNIALRSGGNNFTGTQNITGTLQAANANGQFGFYGFPGSAGTSLLGSFQTADTNWPQLRFTRTMGGNFMDIGQNANGDFVVEGNDVGRLVVRVSGNVGIGTTNPSTALQVVGTVTTTTVSAGSVTTSNLLVNGTNQIAPLSVPPKLPTAAIGSASTDSNPSSVAVVGSYAYVVSYNASSLQVFDVSTPVPVKVGSVSTGSGPSSVAVAGNYAYVVNNSANTFQVFDVSAPSAPAPVGTVGTGTLPACVTVAGNYAYVVDDSGLQIVDVTSPSTPALVGTAGTGYGPVSIAVAGRYAYVVNYISDTLQVFDVTLPSIPVLVGSVTTSNGPNAIAVVGRYAYVACYDSDILQVIDVSNPFSPAVAGSVSTGDSPYAIVVAGRYAYEVNNNNNLHVFDVSNPSAPISAGLVATGSGPGSMAVVGRYAYVVNNSSSTLQVFDLGGAYIQQLEAGAAKVGTLQALDTVTVGNSLNVRDTLNVGGNALVSGGLSVTGPLRLGTGTSIFNLQSGQAVMPPSSTQETNFSITFPVQFSSTPKIIFSLANDPSYPNVSDVFASSVSSSSLNGFTINVYRLNGSLWAQQLRVNWQAWQ